MADSERQHISGPIKKIEQFERIIRFCDSDLKQERKNSKFRLPWVKDTEFQHGVVLTRSYKTIVVTDKGEEQVRIKFVYDGRDGFGKIFVEGEDGLRSLFKCIPDISLGISELHIGEPISTRSVVVKNEKGLAVELTCPFCKMVEQHHCIEKK